MTTNSTSKKHWDSFEHMTEKDWTKSQRWLVNRCLFLLTMKERNPDRFYGGEYPYYPDEEGKERTFEECREIYQTKSYCPEFWRLHIKHQLCMNKAKQISDKEFLDDTISYI